MRLKTFFLLTFLMVSFAFGGEGSPVAVILKVRGEVNVRSSETVEWKDAVRGKLLYNQDIVRTAQKSLAALKFIDNKTIVKVRQNSSFAVEGEREEITFKKKITLLFGGIWSRVRHGTHYEVETTTATAAVKGTEFFAALLGDTATFIVEDGGINLQGEFGEIVVEKGYTGTVVKGKSPVVEKTKFVPTWNKELEEAARLEVEFEDETGRKKKVIIDFE